MARPAKRKVKRNGKWVWITPKYKPVSKEEWEAYQERFRQEGLYRQMVRDFYSR